MKNILIAGSGGVAGIGITRCLTDFNVFGVDDSIWARQVQEAKIYDKEEIDLIIPVADSIITKTFPTNITFLPDRWEILTCQNKLATAQILGDLAAKIYWERDIRRAGGSGAKMIQEYLPGRNFSCELLYKKGKEYGYFIKERLSYSVGNTDTAIDKKGSSAVSVCRNDKRILKLARLAIKKISKVPNGVYAIDFKENEKGIPKITEINPGRFLTASYSYFYNGWNLPKLMVELALGLPLSVLGLYPEGSGVIRQVDSLPHFGKIYEN